ncbi:MAG: hypothetical protein JNM97_21740 [Rhodoferax sp.]|jgi:predicted enzyme related to lactoylglutathione lyase|nr:hypothetical protein [Rhodoferax sp.]
MLDAPRALRIPVTDLAIARAWYGQVLERDPDVEDASSVGFSVGGFQLILQQDDAPPSPGIRIYWAVDDLVAEHARIASIGRDSRFAPPPIGPQQTRAEVADPFGNLLGLVATDAARERHQRAQRTAQKAALQNVRETLDRMQHTESEQKKMHRLIGWAAAVVALLALAFAWTLASLRPAATPPAQVLPLRVPAP